jgi:malate/lactate dehydrogenase
MKITVVGAGAVVQPVLIILPVKNYVQNGFIGY